MSEKSPKLERNDEPATYVENIDKAEWMAYALHTWVDPTKKKYLTRELSETEVKNLTNGLEAEYDNYVEMLENLENTISLNKYSENMREISRQAITRVLSNKYPGHDGSYAIYTVDGPPIHIEGESETIISYTMKLADMLEAKEIPEA